MQYREDFLSMKDDFEELKHQVDDVQKAQLEQGKDVHYIKRSIDELNVKLDKKAPLPTGIAAGIIISVSAAIILMIINILIER